MPMSNESGVDLAQVRSALLAAERQVFANESRDDVLSFAQFIMQDPNSPDDARASRYKVSAHHRLLAEALQEVASGKCLRLAISMPPQHGKSQLASRIFLAWNQGNKPHSNLLMGTYNQDFANEFGDDVRNIIFSREFGQVFPGVALRKGSKAKDHMVTEAEGKMSFIGRGGSGTGRPADGLLIDDPIKDANEAGSLTIRNQVWEWFTQVANSRCHAMTWQIIIQTRWHEDDLIGRLTDKSNPHYDEEVAKQWTYINIPAIMDDAKIAKALGKKIGDALWPERFPLPLLETARRMNPTAFSALYMGKPTPPEGSFYKAEMLKGYTRGELPTNLRYYGTMDLAVSPEAHSDSSVVLNWGLDEDDVLWLLPECFWDKKAADESVEQIIAFAKRYGWFDAWGEKGQIDRVIRPFLEKRMREEKIYFNYNAFPVVGNKAARSVAMRGRMAQGKVRFPKFASWWPRAQEQILKFTGSGNDKEDDFCDALALMGQAMGSQVTAGREVKSDGNVIKVGTLAWIKKQSQFENQNRNATKRLKGF